MATGRLQMAIGPTTRYPTTRYGEADSYEDLALQLRDTRDKLDAAREERDKLLGSVGAWKSHNANQKKDIKELKQERDEAQELAEVRKRDWYRLKDKLDETQGIAGRNCDKAAELEKKNLELREAFEVLDNEKANLEQDNRVAWNRVDEAAGKLKEADRENIRLAEEIEDYKKLDDKGYSQLQHLRKENGKLLRKNRQYAQKINDALNHLKKSYGESRPKVMDEFEEILKSYEPKYPLFSKLNIQDANTITERMADRLIRRHEENVRKSFLDGSN